MLSIENLSLSINGNQILNSISLSLKKHELVGLIGPNGCGKSTLLNAISGFYLPTSGIIVFDNNDITNLPAHKRASMGIGRSFQSAGIFREMTVEDNLVIAYEHNGQFPWWWKFSQKYRRQMNKLITQDLKSVSMEGHQKSLAGSLSGGQLRILELLRLKISGGKLLLIDEPTAGVSPAMRNVLSDLILSLAKNHGKTLLIVEHDMKFLLGLVDRLVVLVDGKNYLDGEPNRIQSDKRLQEVYFGISTNKKE